MKDGNGKDMKTLKALAAEMGYAGSKWLIELTRDGVLQGVFIEKRKDGKDGVPGKEYFHVQDESALVVSLARHLQDGDGHWKQKPEIKAWVDNYISELGLTDLVRATEPVQAAKVADGGDLEFDVDAPISDDLGVVKSKAESERIKLHCQAESAKIELRKLKASVLEAKDVEDFMARVAIELKQSLLSVPNACIQDVLAANDEHEAEAIMYAAIEGCLLRLSGMGEEWERLKEDQVIEMTK